MDEKPEKPERKRKLNSRWMKGSLRYDAVEQDRILSRYRENPGWHRAARVRPARQMRDEIDFAKGHKPGRAR